MDVTPLIETGQQVIQAYGSNGFKINGQIYDHGVIVTPDKTIPWTDKTDVAALTVEDFADVPRDKIILLGTGSTGIFLPKDLMKALREQNLRPDPMDSGAACRTYNVLMAEGRDICAVLMPF